MARESRKRHHGSAEDGDPCTPRPNTRSKTLSSNQHGGPECQVSPQEFPMSSGVNDLPIRQEDGLGIDRWCSPSSQEPHCLPSHRQRQVHQMEGGSLLQRPTSNVNTGQSAGPGNGLGVHVGYSPSSQSAPSARPFLDIVNRRGLFQLVQDTIFDSSIRHPSKVPLINNAIWHVVLEAEDEFTRLRDQLAKLNDQYRSLDQSVCEERRAASQKENEVLAEDVQEKLAEDENPGSTLVFLDLNLVPKAEENSGHELEVGVSNQLETMQQSQILSTMKSLISVLEKSCLEHASCVNVKPREANGHEQKISHEHKPCVKVEPGQANGHDHEIVHHEHCVKSEIGEAKAQVQFNPICGSYSDNSATPNLLGTAFSNAKAAVTRFQKAFLAEMKSREDGQWDLQNVDVFFARPQHVNFYVKSIVNCLFFKGFENESFSTCSGLSRFPDPNLRQANFYEYYHRQKDEDVIEDPQFEEFCKLKGSRRLRKTFQKFCGKSMDVSCFDDLSGPNLDLKLKEAAKSVWLLHKVAFAFEPPASIFRVEQGVDIDPSYMDTIVNLGDNEMFVAKVGFMITPGLRLRESVYPCEVYLSAKSPSCRQIISE